MWDLLYFLLGTGFLYNYMAQQTIAASLFLFLIKKIFRGSFLDSSLQLFIKWTAFVYVNYVFGLN